MLAISEDNARAAGCTNIDFRQADAHELPFPDRSFDAVTVRLGAKEIVHRASLVLNAGELVALVGPNGAGKTTLMRALAGLIPAQGTITLAGQPLENRSPRERARHIAYLPQGHIFHWPLSVESIVMLGRTPHLLAADAAFYSAKNEAAAKTMGVKRVSIPNRSTKSAERKREQKKRWFRDGQKWRTGCEGRISVVKRRHGLNRCRYKGDAGMKRWVGLGVIADNLLNIGRAMALRT